MDDNKMTRKDKVFNLLRENLNVWIEGPRIASPEVGGSEGLNRWDNPPPKKSPGTKPARILRE